jgi:hypothetical protein
MGLFFCFQLTSSSIHTFAAQLITMKWEFSGAVPEIPVSDLKRATAYYETNLGFTIDWGGEEGGIAGVWSANRVTIVSPPESKPWGLHEFTAADPDGNLFRIFYDFATPERETNT